MEQLSATPPRKGNDGRSLSTPKHRKRSPGDALGSGKSQLPITRFYSPVSPSSDLSQPYSPFPSGSGVKRRISQDVKPRKILKTVPDPGEHTVVVSSDDSSEDVFTQDQRTTLVSPVPQSRVKFPVKKRLYPVTSSPISSKSARSKKRRRLTFVPKVNPRRTRFLDSDSEDDVPMMENSSRDSKPLQDAAPKSSRIATASPETSRSKPHQSRAKPDAKRRLRLETSSQAVVITSSDDSDFELHNSKQGNSFLSQSLCIKDAGQSSQKGLLSSQTSRAGDICRRSSAGGIQKSLKKRCSLDVLDDSAYSVSNGHHDEIPVSSRKDYGLRHKDDDGTVCDQTASSIPAANGGDSAIYLQDTLPPSAQNDSSSQSDTDNPNCTGEKRSNSALKPRHLVQTGSPDTANDSNGKDAVARREPLIFSRIENSSNANDLNLSDSTDSDGPSPEILDRNDPSSSIYLHDTIPTAVPQRTLVQSHANETDLSDCCTKQFGTAITPGHPTQNSCQGSVDSPSHQAAETRSPPPGHAIYNEETIDPGFDLEATLDLDSTDDFNHRPLTNGCSTDRSVNRYGSVLPECFPKGTIIEPSDEEDEQTEMHDHTDDMQVNKNRTSLGAIPLSQLLEVTHISGSEDSDFSGIDCSDDEAGTNDRKGEIMPLSDDLSNHVGLQVEDSDDSSNGITSVMNSVLDASADFFSDVICSLGTSDPEHDKESGEHDSYSGQSPTSGIVNIALAVAGIANSSGSPCSVGVKSGRADHQVHLHGESDPDGRDTDCHNSGDRPDVMGTESSPQLKAASRQSLELNVVSDPEEAISLLQNEKSAEEPSCCDALSSREATSVVQNGVTAEESRFSIAPESEGVSPVLHNGPQPCSTMQPDEVVCLTNGSVDAAPRMAAVEPMDVTAMNGESIEMKVVCGSLPAESLARISSLQIRQNMELTLIHNPNKSLLLDTVISECQNYAEHVLNLEPIKTFVLQYSCLPKTSKLALHSGLLDLLEDSNRWLKYGESSTGSVDTLVTSGIFKYLDKNEELFTKLNHLSYSELTNVLCKLGNSPSKCIETMRNIILNKFSSAYTCERVKQEAIKLINRKFVKLTESAEFCVKICLELFALPLNLCDKLYKTADLARFANTLIRDVDSKFLVLPLNQSRMDENPERVLKDLGELCRLKSAVFGSDWKGESLYNRINDICSSIAVMEFSSESDPSVKTSLFRCLMTSYVYALDEQLKFLTLCDSSDVDFGACIYLGVLLKQTVTGSHLKVKWCRERMKHLAKLLDSSNVFEEFSKILDEPVSPVEFFVRSEFVSSSLKLKKLGLSHAEKSHLTRLLRPISHKKTHMAYLPLNSYLNHYSVLAKKPRGKNFNLIRANIFENYKSEFPHGVEDNGGLLINAVYLTFWQAIYLNLDGVFVNKFQSCPLDWGSEDFFPKRQKSVENLCLEMKKHGLPAVFKLVKFLFEKFFSHRCVVDWHLVGSNMTKMLSILEALGIERFLKIGVHVLERVDERVLGFPDVVLWNPESKTVKFLGLRKPADPLYPHQILWLEKLTGFGVDAEELLVSGYVGAEQCSQLK